MSSRSPKRSRQSQSHKPFTLITLFKIMVGSCVAMALGGFVLIAVAIGVTYPKLPSLEEIVRYQPKEQLMIYSSDGVLIGVYGDKKHEFTTVDKFPKVLKEAVLATEDPNFYEHIGIDSVGMSRVMARFLIGDFSVRRALIAKP